MPATNMTADRDPRDWQSAETVNTGQDSPDPSAKEKKRLDKQLDKALEDSFPASDPPAPSQPTGTEPAGDPRTQP